MQQKIASITHLLRVPSICLLCHQYHQQTFAVCDDCLRHFAIIGSKCRYCAFPLPDSTYSICGKCTVKKPEFDKVITSYRFEEPLRTLLHEFKYEEGLYLRNLIARLMLDAFTAEDAQTECLIPVPMHPKRLQSRGFNQSIELAKLLSKRIKRPYHLDLCMKIANTPPQASLNAKKRNKNLKNSFHSKPLPYQHITLVDDLLTTGSTANELAITLKNAGATRVNVWCCARACTEK